MQPSISFEDLFALIPQAIQSRPGHVFHTGRNSLAKKGGLYVLGLNPAGKADAQEALGRTVSTQMQEVLGRRDEWSEYVDDRWNGRPPGTSKMQLRVRHLFEKLGEDPRSVPCSNVMFCCTPRETDLSLEKAELLKACWPFHDALIEALEVRAILCMGGTAGRWVREQVGANELVGEFVEQNNRRWKSRAHRSGDGRLVFTLAHPGTADWTAIPTDPSRMVAKALAAHQPTRPV